MSESSKPKVHLVAGTTGSGKTAFALNLAAEMNGALINIDSRQVYKHLPIGTNREPSSPTSHILHANGYEIPTHQIENSEIEIYLTDFINPDQSLDVYTYRQLALAAIADVISRGKTPILVGGTGMYIDSLLNPAKYNDELSAEEKADSERLKGELSLKSVAELQARLTQLAPDSINQINSSDWNNPRRLVSRILRATQFSTSAVSQLGLSTGITSQPENAQASIPQAEQREPHTPRVAAETNQAISHAGQYEYVIHYLEPDLENLHAKLTQRARAMWDLGIVAEVEQALALGFPRDSVALQGIGFRQVLAYLDSPTTPEIAIADIARAHYQYAKRQLTWFRKYLPRTT